MKPYRTDLAFIHDDGFGHFASGAAKQLIATLQQSGVTAGTVVDLGCGSGITARALTDAGYAVVGFDLSEALIEIARERVPEATFHIDSFIDAALPSCVAVCAIGEVLNYAFDDRSDDAALTALFTDVYAALAPGGLFLFDVAGPARAPAEVTQKFWEGEDWAILVETSAENEVLKRQITTFRRAGDCYRRDAETHRLRLVAPDRVEAELRASGFSVERIDAYGGTRLPPGLHGFVASMRLGV